MQAAPRSTLPWAQPITHMKQPVAMITLRNFKTVQRNVNGMLIGLSTSRDAFRMGPLRRVCVTAASSEPAQGDYSQLPQPRQPTKSTWWSQLVPTVLVSGAIALSLLTPSAARAKAASDSVTSPPPASASGTAPPTWRDTGILLAAKDTKGTEDSTASWVSPEQLDAEARAALSRYADEKTQKQLKRGEKPSKGGKLVRDPLKSRVPDPTTIPPNSEIEKMALQSAWRPDKLKDMTYTQFWNLVGERQVEKARYTVDRRSIYVTTKATAPAGARTEKVGLPFDPDLFDHMVEHG